MPLMLDQVQEFTRQRADFILAMQKPFRQFGLYGILLGPLGKGRELAERVQYHHLEQQQHQDDHRQ